jgi:hypothetical protein
MGELLGGDDPEVMRASVEAFIEAEYWLTIEMFWWDTARYIPTGSSVQVGSQLRWYFAYASTSSS